MSASTATRTASALRPRLLGRSVVNLVVFISVLYTLLPVLWLVLASAKNRDALFSSNILSLSDFSFVQNMKDLFAMDGGCTAAGTATACCTRCSARPSAR